MNGTVGPTPGSWLILMGLSVPLVLLAACGQGGDSVRATNVPIVAVSVLPIAGVVDRLLPPGAAEVRVLVPAGASPHSFEPGMEQLATVQGAELVLELGHPAFAWESDWLDGLLADIKTYAREDDYFWQPAPLLEKLVAEGRTFDDLNKEA